MTKTSALRKDEICELSEAQEKILILESEMRKLPQLDLKVTHHFAPGVYVRELFIPAGTLLIGKIHKTEHMNIILMGQISIADAVSDIAGSKVIDAPHIMVSKPGTKRAGYAHKDTIWVTIHPTKETDLKKIEADVIAKDFSEIKGLKHDVNEILPSKAKSDIIGMLEQMGVMQ